MEEAAAVQATVASSSVSSRFCSVTEMVGEPLIVEVADVSMDDFPL